MASLFRDQGIPATAEYGAVACPRIVVQILKVLYHAGPQGVEVDIANEFQKVGVFFADNRFAPVLEQMATAFMAIVEIDSVPCHQAAHNLAQRSVARPE